MNAPERCTAVTKAGKRCRNRRRAGGHQTCGVHCRVNQNNLASRISQDTFFADTSLLFVAEVAPDASSYYFSDIPPKRQPAFGLRVVVDSSFCTGMRVFYQGAPPTIEIRGAACEVFLARSLSHEGVCYAILSVPTFILLEICSAESPLDRNQEIYSVCSQVIEVKDPDLRREFLIFALLAPGGEKGITSKEIAPVVAEFRERINQGNSVFQPAYVRDFLLFNGPIHGQTVSGNLFFFSLRPINLRPKAVLDIPFILNDIIEYGALLAAGRGVVARLRALPLGGESPQEYLRELRGQELTTLQMYEAFLRDEERIIVGSASEARRYQELEEKFLSHYSLLRQHLENAHIEVDLPHEYRRQVLGELVQEASSVHKAFSAAITDLRSNETTVSRYLRDRFAAATAVSSQQIQESVHRIGYGGLVVAVIAVFLALLPEREKLNIWEVCTQILAGFIDWCSGLLGL